MSAQTSELVDTSGNAFVRLCSAIDKENGTDEETRNLIMCLGYVSGFVDALDSYSVFREALTKQKEHKLFCKPEEIERGQVVRIVLKYIRNHPEHAHGPTGVLFIGALREAYPCTK
jgi:hypothetical protein